MWEVFGPIVRWPLYSPLRFFAVVAATLVAVFVIGGVNSPDSPAAGGVASASPSTSRGVRTAGLASLVSSASPGSPASTGPSVSASSSSSGPRRHVTSTSGGDSPASDDLSVDPGADDPAAAAANVAASLVAAWARPDLDAKSWAAGVRPLVTPALWTTGLSLTEPSSTPAETVAGEPRQVAISADEAVFDVPTTGTWVRVHLVPGSAVGSWLVSMIEPAG